MMPHKGSRHRTRAVSPILSTIILVAITIAGGLLVYSVFTNASNTASTNTQVTVQSVQLVKVGSTTSFTINIKNTGSTQVTIAANGGISLGTADTANIPAADMKLDPGQTKSVTVTSLLGSYDAGSSYPVTIKLSAANGDTFATSTTVLCTSK